MPLYQAKSKHTQLNDDPQPHQLLKSISSQNMRFNVSKGPDHSIAQLKLKSNNTGLPDHLKSGMEHLSGMSLNHVKVHYNSPKPAMLQAHAYAQGSDIHLGAGQEKHLPHELAHVVQQAQGRVKPTTTVGGMRINDNAELEKEADMMGAKALQMRPKGTTNKPIANTFVQNKATVKQDSGIMDNQPKTEKITRNTKNTMIQRMIRDYPPQREVPHETKGYYDRGFWKRLTNYLYFQTINTRDQTFEDAVLEHIKLQPGKAMELRRTWRDIQSKLNSHSADIMNDINSLILNINSWEFFNTSHPNKAGTFPANENPASMPQSETSQVVTARVRRALIRDMFPQRQRIISLYGNKPNKWVNSFMLGGMVTPNGDIYLSHTAALAHPKQQEIFDEIVRRNHGIPLKKEEMHAQRIQYLKAKNTTLDEPGEAVLINGERGMKAGICAAPQVLGNSAIKTKSLKGSTPLSITELWVSEREGGPSIADAQGHDQEYSGDEDVRSCLTCQHQLDDLVKNLRNALKHQDNLASIESEVNKNSVIHKMEQITAEVHQIKNKDNRKILLDQLQQARLRYPANEIRQFLLKQLRTTGNFDLNTLPPNLMKKIETVMSMLKRTSKLATLIRKKGLLPRKRFSKR